MLFSYSRKLSHPVLGLLVLTGVATVLSGCRPSDEIRTYRAPQPTTAKPAAADSASVPLDMPKQSSPPWAEEQPATLAPVHGDPSAEGAHPPGKPGLYGAIVLHGSTAWFFKTTGSAEAIEKHEAEITAFLKSVSLAEGEDALPQWVPPATWKKDPPSGIRYATFRFGDADAPLEMSVTPLATSEKDEQKYLLSIVNFWRSQIGLDAIDRDSLEKNISELPMQNVKATIIKITGPDDRQ